MAFLEVHSFGREIVTIVLSKMKCTPQELRVLLTTEDAYFLHYLNEKYID